MFSFTQSLTEKTLNWNKLSKLNLGCFLHVSALNSFFGGGLCDVALIHLYDLYLRRNLVRFGKTDAYSQLWEINSISRQSSLKRVKGRVNRESTGGKIGKTDKTFEKGKNILVRKMMKWNEWESCVECVTCHVRWLFVMTCASETYTWPSHDAVLVGQTFSRVLLIET